MDNLAQFNPIVATFLATLFTYIMTTIGAASVFLFRTVNRKLLDLMLGFAGGVMIAASFWSLLAPAIEMSKGGSLPLWFPSAVGFLAGAGFLFLLDRIMPHLHLFLSVESAEGLKTTWSKTTLLILAITLHNIPEGLAVGVAFGAASLGVPEASPASAVALAIGLGLQNLPEGLAVSGPLRAAGLSPKHSFFLGQLSGLVEPLAGILGALAVIRVIPILPYAMSFAAGAMIFVVIEEVIPESQQTGKSDLATIGLITGFVVMMILDVALS
ncbi:MAG: ZIP family metal transporter [Acidobacteriota bacterium]|nr:ZIP family metal transporter [Acidobacteriota bacterium]MDW3229150.1 ZIP family metal transporter [Acidobacteriota bacterium]MDY0231257.1 ZIP family metal transporter [Candidatus Saccharicenans sp.]